MTPTNPIFISAVALAVAAGLTIAGVYLLAGPGWALLAGAAPFLALGLTILRGLRNAKQIAG